jgi:hypothetical protein
MIRYKIMRGSDFDPGIFSGRYRLCGRDGFELERDANLQVNPFPAPNIAGTRLVSGLKAEIVPSANHKAQVTAPDLVYRKIQEFLLS